MMTCEKIQEILRRYTAAAMSCLDLLNLSDFIKQAPIDIFALAKELETITEERDYAIKHIKGDCARCKNLDKTAICETCDAGKNKWEWKIPE